MKMQESSAKTRVASQWQLLGATAGACRGEDIGGVLFANGITGKTQKRCHSSLEITRASMVLP